MTVVKFPKDQDPNNEFSLVKALIENADENHKLLISSMGKLEGSVKDMQTGVEGTIRTGIGIVVVVMVILSGAAYGVLGKFEVSKTGMSFETSSMTQPVLVPEESDKKLLPEHSSSESILPDVRATALPQLSGS